MMQQPQYQQEQAGNQGQQQQQMLLCPVRLVYETQILVQPGDQIQPNQTILINPQNQPPWAQNRLQNQLLYVQNVPNNYMPPVQQHVDQNQMFLQQNYGYPQVIQHPMIAQNQEQIRTLQVGNVPANIQTQMQSNVAQIMPNERMVAHNFGHLQVNPGVNITNAVQNQIANVPISANNRLVQNVPKPNNEMPNNPQKSQEIAAHNYRQLVNQHITHQMNVARAPMQQIAMIPMPNMTHKPPNLEHNTAQVNSVQQQVIVPVSNTMQQTFANATTIQVEPRKAIPIVQKAPSHSVSNTTHNHTHKNQAYSYRPIQPRPQPYRNNVQTPAVTVQPAMNIQIQPNPNFIDINRSAGPSVVNATANYQKVDTGSVHFNRKRKSESPDELQRKLTIVPTSQTITTTNSMTVKRIEHPVVPQSISVTKINTNEVGVNTNPVMKINSKISTNTRNVIQISPIIDQNAKIKEELAKPVQLQEMKPLITVTTLPNTNALPNSNTPTQVEKEKLVRNTVFTQARFGRLLSDKDDVPVNINSVVTKETSSVQAQEDKSIIKDEVKTEIATTSKVKSEESSTKVEVKKEKKKVTKEEVKEEVSSKKPEVVKEEKPVVPERNAEEKMLSDSMNRLKGTEANEIKLKSERDYILTHVLDGFVIQESNVAFPIRLPLKERALIINRESKKNAKESADGDREAKSDKVPDLSHLNLSENERLKNNDEETEESEDKEGNPFMELEHCAVKSWTVEQLATHLSKYNWADTITVLQEHEIDGESLFLVSKNQLVTIGVKENHADFICEFVKG